ncbi:MAG TPA: M50 family metallopeptidase [Polyangiaceae bacterium]|jgi:regulator of sigma E protease
MSWFHIIVGILGLALLMVVHEGGHLLAARAFGMRVIRFSIGFGPAVWRHQPRDSETVYQVALIPFLAYVQIAGMNPLEEVDPEDKGSYANATLPARISAIVAGPLANYLFASILFFGAFLIGGKAVPTTKVEVMKEGAAANAQMRDGDTIVSIDGRSIHDWEQMREIILKSPDKELAVVIERDGKPLTLTITPRPQGDGGGGLIGVTPVMKNVPIGAREAAINSVTTPAIVVKSLVVGLARIITGQEKAQLTGPVGIVKETGKAAKRSLADYLFFLGLLSAYLGGFNMVPFPALDGGRLMFLGYEAVSRRRPDAKVEASVHAVGLAMLIVLIAVVSVFDIRGN